MDVHLATMNTFFPSTGSLEDWNAAYYRLEDYLRAHHLTSKLHQNQIIFRILQRAAEAHARVPQIHPIQLAMEEAYAEIDMWFRNILGDREMSPDRLTTMGKVALQSTDATARWPVAFLSGSDIPEELQQTLCSTAVRSGPDLNISSMVPRVSATIEAERLENAMDRLGLFHRVALLVAILLMSGAIFILSR
jgi:hypothetical protein